MSLALDRWETSKAGFCARVARNQAVFKIVLKTKDDFYFLEPWIEHHARIVGYENLIVLDNMSSDERVRRTYAEYQSRVLIIQFEGYHNRVHHTDHYPELYSCLRQSCQFYAFFDTDEFLVLIEGGSYSCDREILGFLEATRGADALPATWLNNVSGSDRTFAMNRSIYDFGMALAFGKPILRSRAEVEGYINHNVLVPRSLFTGEVTPNFFLLHMTQLFPQQRIDANMNKLRAEGFATAEDTPETLATKDAGAISESDKRLQVQRWTAQVQEMVARRDEATSAATIRDYVELGEAGAIRFSEPPVGEALHAFLSDAQPFIHVVLDSKVLDLRTTPHGRLKEQWRERAASWDPSRIVASMRSIVDACVPADSGIAVVSKGDARLLEIGRAKVWHFPHDEGGAYAGWYPRDDAEAIDQVEAARQRGIDALIFPRAAFWWLDHYAGLHRHLASAWNEVWRSEECIVYRSSPRPTVAAQGRVDP